ncbi:MAG: hypothetical protein KDC28_07435 [Saprospiraceae bacterium]|nr:hypothetical protein [Saprospiraceae bacterium]MCB9319082.1 hypothetical protein [Lewinellaceae bacterium]
MKTRVLELSIAFLLFVLLLPYSSLAVNSRRFVPPTALEQYALDPSLNISVAQFADLSIKDLQNMSHRKLRLEDKLAFKLTQRAIKKKIKEGKAYNFDDAPNYRFNIGGFLLGFFLGIVGVLLALLFGRNAFRSSLIGLLCWVIILLIWFLV